MATYMILLPYLSCLERIYPETNLNLFLKESLITTGTNYTHDAKEKGNIQIKQ